MTGLSPSGNPSDEEGRNVPATDGSRRDLYVFGGPFYAVHFNGHAYAEFGSASQAAIYQRGMDAQERSYFHFEDANGKRIEIKENPAAPGHAHAIPAALEKHERECQG